MLIYILYDALIYVSQSFSVLSNVCPHSFFLCILIFGGGEEQSDPTSDPLFLFIWLGGIVEVLLSPKKIDT